MAKRWWQRALSNIGVSVHLRDDQDVTYDRALAAEGRYVFVINDDVSPMKDVIRFLERSFELSTAEAAALMATVHNRGFVPIGPFEAEEVLRLIERATPIAASLGLDQLVFTSEEPSETVRRGEGGAIARSKRD